MLNPNATEFRPSDPPKTIPQRSSKGEKYKDKKKQRTQQQSKADQNLASSQPSESHLQSAPKTSDGKKKQQGKSRKNAPSSTGGSSRRATGRRESAQQNSLASASTTQPFDQPVKFITIEEAIDPVFRMRPDMREMSAIGDDGRARGKLVHGYERYIEWVIISCHYATVAKEDIFFLNSSKRIDQPLSKGIRDNHHSRDG